MKPVIIAFLLLVASYCIDAGEKKTGCDYKGKHYSHGDTFMDDCNTCTCNHDASCTCTEMSCTSGEEHPCNSMDCGDGKVCYINENGNADCKDDECMTKRCGWGKICVTNSDGTASCVAPDTCDYNGMTYHEGDTFPSDDGCNQCSCTNCNVICTERPCPLLGCQTNNDCQSGDYCKKDSCDDSSGSCSARIEFCNEQPDQVCGCDGQTYADACAAASAGVNVQCNGSCPAAPQAPQTPQGGQQTCQSNNDCESGCYCEKESCGADVQGYCTERYDVCAEISNPVCGCDGNTYDNACEAANEGVSVDYAGECEGSNQGAPQQQTCQSNTDCGTGCYCVKTSCGATTGTCTEYPNTPYVSVCGCDGQTYPNSCEAANAGVNVQNNGECPAAPQAPQTPQGGQQTCQSNTDCGTGTFCYKTYCTDTTGTCTPNTDLCTTPQAPVCGCDNQNYNNSCSANYAGVNVQYQGQCAHD